MRSRRGVAAGALTLAALLLGGGVAQAQGPVLEDGKTKAVYDYTQAVRERVFIPQPGIDQDGNGRTTSSPLDILRPSEGVGHQQDAGDHRSEPVLHDGLPRQRGPVHGRLRRAPAPPDGVNDRWPLFYDNYFVPRGYAYILAR